MGDQLGTDKDVEALARRARQAGWTVDVDGGTHLRWRAPDARQFRSPLTGSRTVRLRVERNLAMLDPEHFRDVAPAVADRASRAQLSESPAVRREFQDEAAVAAAELLAAAELVEDAADAFDPRAAAEACRLARQILRDLEDGFWSLAR